MQQDFASDAEIQLQLVCLKSSRSVLLVVGGGIVVRRDYNDTISIPLPVEGNVEFDDATCALPIAAPTTFSSKLDLSSGRLLMGLREGRKSSIFAGVRPVRIPILLKRPCVALFLAGGFQDREVGSSGAEYRRRSHRTRVWQVLDRR